MLKYEHQSFLIREYLARFTAYVHLSNGESKNDINHDAERFYGGLLNIVLSDNPHCGYQGRTIALTDMNALRKNYPAIDLGDPANRLAVQVSSTEEREKVRSTLMKFFEHHLDEKFDRLIMLIIGSRDSYIRKFDVTPGFDFQIERDVWDTKRLGKEISRLSPQRRQLVLEYLQDQFEDRGISTVSLYLPPVSALDADSFVGREKERGDIQEKLMKGAKPIVLSGLGGMGKTELAVHFGRSYTGGAVYFTRFQDSFTRTVAKMAEGLRPKLSKAEAALPEEDRCELVLDILEGCEENDILIIDNVDANSGTLKKLMADPAYARLQNMDIRLILTSRFDHDRSLIGVPAMDDDALFQIFTNHGANIPETDKKALIDAVNGHTLTVDLIARTLADEWTPVTAEEMLNALAECKLADAEFAEVDTDWHESKEQLHIYQRLRKVFEVVRIPPMEQDILRFATLLPESGMDVRYFRAALTKEQQKAFPALGKRGWLTAEDGLLTIHPVIRLVCREELKPDEESCVAFLDALWGQFDQNEYDRVKFAQMAEVFAAAMEIDGRPETKAEWLNHSGCLWNDLMESRKCAALYEKYIPDLEKQIPSHPALAASYNNVGLTYGALGDHSKALEYKVKDLAICEKVLPPEHPHLATSYNNVGLTYGDLGDHSKALEYLLKALAIREKVLPPEHPDLATSYNNVGLTYGDLGDHSKALEYQLKALAIFEKALPPEHPELAASYNNVGMTYGALGDHYKALVYNLKALAIWEKALPPEHPDLATSYNNIGITYSALGDQKRALEYKLKALAIREKALPPEHPDLATSYNNIGTTYSALCDHNKALEYQLKALAIREKALPPEHPSLATSYNNIGITYANLEQFSKAAEYLEKALVILKKSLPENHPHIASSEKSLEGIRFMAMLQEAGLSLDDLMKGKA